MDLLAEAERIYTDAAEDLARTLGELRRQPAGNAKAARDLMRGLREAFSVVMQEREKIERLRLQVAGAVGAGQLDFDAARDEIGRRLACLRDAAGGG